ncbi:hypothetical protein CGI35_16685 [Vibrio parahaemolyticus]|nr:hypothetical protein CGI35_16685 [Vibrio parahaemolyticus]
MIYCVWREFRAVRIAEQSPSDTNQTCEVTPMEKQLQSTSLGIKSTLLVIFGWLAFFSTFLLPPDLTIAAILLQSVARVLP